MRIEFHDISLESNYQFALIYEESFLYKSDQNISDTAYLKDSFINSLYCGFSDHGIRLLVLFPAGFEVNTYSTHLEIWWLVSLIGFIVIVFSGTLLFRSINRLQTESGRRIIIINNLAHEFKTPLASIKLASEMLMNEQIIVQPNRVHRYGELLQFEVRRLQFQGEQILSMALLEEGQIMLKFEYVSANEVIKKLVENYLVVRSDLVHQLITNLHSDNDIIYVDLGHFQNVISNLIENAFKYGGDNVMVEVNTGNNANGIIIGVVDNGIGIARKYQKAVFERFFRISINNRHDIKGHGIGLYYVKNILAKMGGRIALTSAPNKGARFEIFFPFEHI
jgi:signal transduction histidine kinase